MKPLVTNVRHFCHIKIKGVSAIATQKIDYTDFTFVLSGTMTYFVNGQKYILNDRDAIFFPPGSIRERMATDTPVEFVSFNFNAERDYDFFPVFMKNCITESICTLFSVYSSRHIGEGLGASVEKCVCMLNYTLLELEDRQLTYRNPHVGEMLEYLNRHCRERVTLDEVAAQVFLSKEYCANIFKAETGKTIIGYLNDQKMELAGHLIEGNEMKLSDIALYLGFDNYSYFSRLFRRYYGFSPLAAKRPR